MEPGADARPQGGRGGVGGETKRRGRKGSGRRGRVKTDEGQDHVVSLSLPPGRTPQLPQPPPQEQEQIRSRPLAVMRPRTDQ